MILNSITPQFCILPWHCHFVYWLYFPLLRFVQISLPRERGRLRFHALQNVQTALDLLKYKNIRLVNIRPDEIVDGNPKLTLGLIWTIILHFQVC